MPGDKEIAFVTDRGEGPALWAIDLASRRERRLFAFGALPRPPSGGKPTLLGAALSTAMSPDFTRIAYSVVQQGVSNVWVAPVGRSRPAGTLVQRTFEPQAGAYPSWSPDGRWLAYQCSEGPHTHLCLTEANGGGRIQLTNQPGLSWVGEWSPDGEHILIAARRDAVWNVAAVSTTTKAVRMLTSFSEPRIYVRYPRWDRAHQRAIFERFEAIGKMWMVELPPAR